MHIIIYKVYPNNLTTTTLFYKNIEFLTAYLEDEDVERLINGAPLVKLDTERGNGEEIEPCGFQRI